MRLLIKLHYGELYQARDDKVVGHRAVVVKM